MTRGNKTIIAGCLIAATLMPFAVLMFYRSGADSSRLQSTASLPQAMKIRSPADRVSLIQLPSRAGPKTSQPTTNPVPFVFHAHPFKAFGDDLPLPQDVKPAAEQRLITSFDVAMHPSLKYIATPVAIAKRPFADSVYAIPAVALQIHGTGGATTIPTSTVQRTAAPVTESNLSSRTLTEANLRMEQDRRFVMSMCEDRQGCLWVGTEGGGIQRFDSSAAELHQWTQFTTKDGLGDDNGYAIACDHRGRIWAGHLNHGVSVFNGKKWQCYEQVKGLSRPDTLGGPIGERVFSIKVCPTDGDVWIATNCGLSRYCDDLKKWTYFTRADGLASDQASGIAFDKAGNIYVGTQCDGIIMANAADHYESWRTATSSDREPEVLTGDGLPSNLINDVLVANDGTVYAATAAGLAWSKDRGNSWRFRRGNDWSEKVRGLGGAAPSRQLLVNSIATLAEDFLTSLDEAPDGRLWIGYRQKGLDQFDPRTFAVIRAAEDPGRTVKIASTFSRTLAFGTYGDGCSLLKKDSSVGVACALAPTEVPLPAGALSLDLHALEHSATTIQRSMPSSSVAAFVGEDWATQGNWVGRYGRQYAELCAADSPFNHEFIPGWGHFAISAEIQSRPNIVDSLRYWIGALQTTNPNCLWDPAIGYRRSASWDDHGEVYPMTLAGPGILIHIGVPQGIYDVSIYFYNADGHSGDANFRDYVVELVSDHAQNAEVLARCRASNFYNGVYKTFRVAGPGGYALRIDRNHSFNTMCSAVMIDAVGDSSLKKAGLPLPSMGSVVYESPEPDEYTLPLSMLRWLKIWQSVKLPMSSQTSISRQRRLAFECYRGAASASASADMLDNWRWYLRLWSVEDRIVFEKSMRDGWASMVEQNPQLHISHYR